VEMEATMQDLDIIGVFHSHPDHPPVASPRDLAWAAWPGYSYLITEIRTGQPASSRSWQMLGDRSGFAEEQLEKALCARTKQGGCVRCDCRRCPGQLNGPAP
jgi:proteasome lid subunit RPN8/RPN11